MILTAGYNVYPSEIEHVLYDHPAIHEAAVFGVSDEHRGETVGAAVTLTQDGDLPADDVRTYVLEELAPYQPPPVRRNRRRVPQDRQWKSRKHVFVDDFDLDA